MEKMSLYLTTASFVVLALAFLLYLGHLLSKREGVGKLGTLLTWMGAIFLGLALALRWITSGHAPFANMYEYSLSFAWGVPLSYVIVERRYRQRVLALFVLPVALGLLAYASTIPSSIEPLVPALQNNLLLTVHVSVAIIAYGLFAVSFGAAVMYLIQGGGRKLGWLPPGALLDQVGYRSVVIGFPFFALMIILGAFWANTAWGRYWGWDPKETASLVTWLIYAAYLHARNLRGWRGRPSALLLVLGFIATLFTYFGVNLWISGLHSYAGL